MPRAKIKVLINPVFHNLHGRECSFPCSFYRYSFLGMNVISLGGNFIFMAGCHINLLVCGVEFLFCLLLQKYTLL